MNLRALTLIALAALGACSPKPDRGPATPLRKGEMPVREIMRAHIEPSAQVYWHAAGTIYTADGKEVSLVPTTDAGWAATLHAMEQVETYARQLQRSSRGRGRKDWQNFTTQLIAKAEDSQAAITARDGDAMFNTGGELYGICSACHQVYLLPFLGPDGRPKQIDENGMPIARDPNAPAEPQP